MRVEQTEVVMVTKNASNGRMISGVANRNQKTKGGGPTGRFQFITYAVEMPVPYSIYSEISEKNNVWESKDGYTRNIEDIMRL